MELKAITLTRNRSTLTVFLFLLRPLKRGGREGIVSSLIPHQISLPFRGGFRRGFIIHRFPFPFPTPPLGKGRSGGGIHSENF